MQCPECGIYCCDKCKQPITIRPFTIPLPFGNLDARIVTTVCGDCWKEYIRLGFEWLGRTVPEEYKK